MSTIAIGDVHGNYRALEDLLAQVDRVATSSDTVVFLGDYVDRGEQSKECIDYILSFSKDTDATVVTLLGNHEQWLLRTADDYTRHSWIFMGAFPTIESYSQEAAATIHDEIRRLGPKLVLEHVRLPYELFFDSVPKQHIQFFRSLKVFHRSPDAVCVHGGLDPSLGAVEHQDTESLVWGTDDFPDAYDGEDRIMYGHANNAIIDENGWPQPRISGRTYGLDTISEGVLTAVRLPDGCVFQSARHKYE
jgi:serine/threonine protein phosphatase 1